MRPARIVVTDTVMLNTGDAAILIGLLRALRSAFGNAVEFQVAELQPDAARRLYPEISFGPTVHAGLAAWAGKGTRFKLALAYLLLVALLWRSTTGRRLARLLPDGLRDTLGRFAAADAVVATGGTYLVPYYRLTPRIVNFLACLALRRPLVLFTQSLGPFRRGIDGLILRAILRRCCLILVRDDSSRRHLRAIGVPKARIVMCADAAFALAPPPPADDGARPAGMPLRVAISLRDWPHFGARDGATSSMETYLAAIAETVNALVVRHRARITFVSTCQGEPVYWTDDSKVADRVLPLLPAAVRRHVEVDRIHRRPEALIERFREFDMVIATRMHALILALCARRPVIGIAYEFKTRELMQRVGLGELVVDIEDATGERLIARFQHLLAARGGIEASLERRVVAEREDALAAGVIVRDALFPAAAAA